MTDTATRNLKDLASQAGVDLSPEQASEEQMRALSKGVPLTVIAVEHKEHETFGGIWEYTVKGGGFDSLLFGLWDNPQRDATSTVLMQLCQDGPVTGVLLENKGSDKKPFYVLVPA